jgi:hypothetical protein
MVKFKGYRSGLAVIAARSSMGVIGLLHFFE